MYGSVPKSCAFRKFVYRNTENINEDAPSTFTIMSYNLLSQTNIRRELFPYANSKSLKWKYRKNNLIQEILHHSPDIACLQEVGIEHWHVNYKPEFERNGYNCYIYFSKFKNHGVAIISKKKIFNVIEHLEVPLGHQVQVGDEKQIPANVGQILVLEFKGNIFSKHEKENNDIEVSDIQKTDSKCIDSELSTLPSSNFSYRENEISSTESNSNDKQTKNKRKFSCDEAQQDTKGNLETTNKNDNDNQISSSSGAKIIIANTHLFWKPEGSFERLLQMILLLNECKKAISKHSPHCQLVLCGDFNTTPDDALYSLLTKQKPFELTENDIEQLLPCSYEDEKDFVNIENDIGDGSESPDVLDIKEFEKEQQEADAIYKNDLNRVQNILQMFNNDFGSMTFKSLYGAYSDVDPSHSSNDKWQGEPLYTNYTKWKGTLDYIMTLARTDQENTSFFLEHQDILSLPPQKHLEPGLPNNNFSSDHISLLAEINCIINDNFEKSIL
ncbi:hypothetical protein BB559_005849 [Furculomyces boomerangus]|uniref:Endonuclease/exonuclease/phosphatase domain-containing protein n=2 Tax=Harpellales TaxID=61421 RepID=A0A2T9Y6C3_9FUNG|nr:hypothetical protein BB559_005849 [Furculomyces boomerangus]PWA02690.1 hypothetical protein BB558_001177 [Smittium angustum]